MNVRVTETANGKGLALVIGQSFTIALPENPTAAYRWEFTKTGAPLCALLHDSFNANSGQVGGSGTHEWHFRAERPGAATIEMQLTRGWDRAAATDSFMLRLHVT